MSPGSTLRTGRSRRTLLSAAWLLSAGVLPSPLLAASPDVPAPEAVLGFVPGDDRKLADWSQVLAYLHALAAASGRIRVEEIAQTTQGRPFVLVTVSSEANQARLEEIRRDNARLADPRG